MRFHSHLNVKFYIPLLLIFSFNTGFAQTAIEGGNVSGVWEKTGSPYLIKGNITIPQNQKLTIKPGVKIRFSGNYGLFVNGSIYAVGTATDSIFFTTTDTTGFYKRTHLGWGGIRIENVGDDADSTLLDHCKIEYAKYNAGGVTDGGSAVFVANFSKARISHCLLQKNQSGMGAGIYSDNADIIIKNNLIRNNSAAQVGAGVYVHQGSPLIVGNTIKNNFGSDAAGGMYFNNSRSTVSNNIVSHNRSIWSGAGIAIYQSELRLLRNIIAFNESGDFGGGLAIYSSSPTIINNTICYNEAEEGEGVFIADYSRPVFINTIIYSNRDKYQKYNSGDEIFMNSDNSDPDFYNCNIQGGIEGIVHEYGTLTGVATDNINALPLFSDTVAGDFFLTWKDYPANDKKKSPCIDAGKFDSPHDPDGSRADIGALYFNQNYKNFKPRIDFSADTLLGFNTLEVQFSDLSDPGNGPISEWHWDFGDGNTSDLQNPLHTFDSPGAFDVTLTIKDTNGFEKQITREKYIRMYDGTYIKGNVEGVFASGRYLVGGEIVVEEEKSLRVEPGAEFIFFGNYEFKVFGALKALGKPNKPIVFTSNDTTGLNLENPLFPGKPGGWGGIYIYLEGPKDSTIIDNCKIEFVENFNRGSIYAFSQYAGIRISNSEISYNSTQGISVFSSNIVIRNNYIHHNYSANYSQGSGIYCTGGAPKIINNIICSNKCPGAGGGICIRYGTPSLINNVICHNAAERGGGVCDYQGGHNPINNTICFNTSDSGAAGYILVGGDVKFTNTIIAKNYPEQVEIIDPSTQVGFTHSILEGGKEGIVGYQNVFLYENVITLDPLVASPTYAHGRLLANSPGINAGTLTNVASLLPLKDLLGNTRVTNSSVDIGAYEYADTQPVGLKEGLADEFKEEDFDPFSIPVDSIFAYAHGARFLNMEIVNASNIDLLQASVRNRHLYIRALSDRFGDEAITVSASDGISSITRTLSIHIGPVNDPPVFTTPGDLSLLEDFSSVAKYQISPTIPFGEEDQTVTYSLSPMNTDFVNVSFSPNGSLVFSARENAFGSEEFTLTADDGRDHYGQSFQVVVSAVNDLPVISTLAETVLFVGDKLFIPVTVHDVDNDPITFVAYATRDIVALKVVKAEENKFTLEVKGVNDGTGALVLNARDLSANVVAEIGVVVKLVTSAEQNIADAPLLLYPNPTEAFVVFDGKNFLSGSVAIYNSRGEKILNLVIDDSQRRVNIEDFAAGIYVFKVSIGKNIYTYKIVKQ